MLRFTSVLFKHTEANREHKHENKILTPPPRKKITEAFYTFAFVCYCNFCDFIIVTHPVCTHDHAMLKGFRVG